MTFLTEDQRTKALELLKKAPDEIILGAMVDLRRYRHMEDGTRYAADREDRHGDEGRVAQAPGPRHLSCEEIRRTSEAPVVSQRGEVRRRGLLPVTLSLTQPNSVPAVISQRPTRMA